MLKEGKTMNEKQTSRAQEAIRNIQGKTKRIWTIAIVSAANPMGGEATPEYNEEATQRFIHNLSTGHTIYFPTKGKYGSLPESSIFIYNVTLSYAKAYADTFNQESMVFVDITSTDHISYQIWKRPAVRKQLRMVDEQHDMVDTTNDDENYAMICHRFKISVPFFEGYIRTLTALNETPFQKEIDKYLLETTSPRWSGLHQYVTMGKLYGKWDENGDCHKRENRLYELSELTKSIFGDLQ